MYYQAMGILFGYSLVEEDLHRHVVAAFLVVIMHN